MKFEQLSARNRANILEIRSCFNGVESSMQDLRDELAKENITASSYRFRARALQAQTLRLFELAAELDGATDQ